MAKNHDVRGSSSRSTQAARMKRSGAAATAGRRPMIVTFKPKDRRPDKTDKVQIMMDAIGARPTIYDAAKFSAEKDGAAQIRLAHHECCFDVNRYEAPIVSLWLNREEISRLEQNPNIAVVEKDGRCHALPVPMVAGPTVAPAGEIIPPGVQQVNAQQAWQISRGAGVRVAVLDTGIDPNHPNLAPNFQSGVSFVPELPFLDGDGHGTHCAGIIGAAQIGSGVVGVAPKAGLFAVRVLDENQDGDWSSLISALDWCIHNQIQIASMSLSGIGAPSALELMCNAAFNAGMLLIAGAGNSGPAMNSVEEPASYVSVIAVSSVDRQDVIAPGSSRGPEVGLSAPGVEILSTLTGNTFGERSGTSMACPHVAGGAAVVWAVHEKATNIQIWDLLASTADNVAAAAWDPSFGYGRLDVNRACVAAFPAPSRPFRP